MVGWLRVSPRVSRTVQNQSKIVQLSLFIPPFCPFFGPPCIYPSFSRVPKRPLFSFFLFLMKQFVSRSGFSARSAKLVSPSRLPSWAPRRGSKGRAVGEDHCSLYFPKPQPVSGCLGQARSQTQSCPISALHELGPIGGLLVFGSETEYLLNINQF